MKGLKAVLKNKKLRRKPELFMDGERIELPTFWV